MHIHTYRYIDISRLDTYRYTYMYIYVINPFSTFYFFLRIEPRKDLKNYNKLKFTRENYLIIFHITSNVKTKC